MAQRRNRRRPESINARLPFFVLQRDFGGLFAIVPRRGRQRVAAHARLRLVTLRDDINDLRSGRRDRSDMGDSVPLRERTPYLAPDLGPLPRGRSSEANPTRSVLALGHLPSVLLPTPQGCITPDRNTSSLVPARI